ncbi:MAG: sensor histidine kinase [Vicinamibacterales bacterium]
MATELSNDFGALVAERLRAAHRELAARWLAELKELLPVDLTEIFPTDQILDHIPMLIREIADCVGAEGDPVAANTAIQSKAHELGELRFAQKASVHQLLREYRILGTVMAGFIREQLDELGHLARPAEAVDVLTRLHEAVFVLLQMTVETYTARYTERIEEQTTRLEGFNRMVSHELRQPLSSVQYAVDVLEAGGGRDAAQQRHVLGVARRNLKRLADLIRVLGALVRPEHDTIQRQRLDVSKIVEEAMSQLREMATARGVMLHNRVPRTELTLDLPRLELVVVNLVSNGIKYRDPQKADPFVAVELEVVDGTCSLRIRDNGLGISADHQPQVFQRFFRAHGARDGELANDGVGLGLTIVAECVKAMRGTITMDSEEGVGTAFTVTLPDCEAEAPAGNHEASASAPFLPRKAE